MDLNVYSYLFNIVVSGIMSAFSLHSLLAFSIVFFFSYAAANKVNNSNIKIFSIELFWSSISILVAFFVTSLILFLLAIPAIDLNMGDIIFMDISLYGLLKILATIMLLIASVWLFLPQKNKVDIVKVDKDDDLSSASLVSLLVGVGISEAIFLGANLPNILLEQTVNIEIIRQIAFYIMFYLVGFVSIWVSFLVVIYFFIGRFIYHKFVPIYGLIALLLGVIKILFA